MKAYRIRDCQFEVRYFADGALYKTKKDVIEQLASYHDIDFSDERYNTIYKWLENFKNEEDKLNALLEYGQWEIEEVVDTELIDIIIDNFIIYYTDDRKERENMREVLNEYLKNGEPFC